MKYTSVFDSHQLYSKIAKVLNSQIFIFFFQLLYFVFAENQMSLDEAQNHFRVITVNDAGVGKHWCDNEVRALINIWSDEEIQQTLEGATRNKEIFEEIARRLMKVGIDRDWKQCRTKYKNLKYEYRALQKDSSQLGSARRRMRFYDEINCILRSQPLGTYMHAHRKEN